MLRRELSELRQLVEQVREGALAAGDARSALNEMAMRQNDGLQRALDSLTDALLSHLSYEEHELVEPLARLGFYADQV
jgi:hypothetical protein